jgi:cell division septation protein DedD
MLVILPGCTGYKQTQRATDSIWDVRVTTHPADVGSCRLIGGVDSRDTQRGCGLTVQPTFEECLRYQVRLAGGDTLLMNGPIGEAYDCSGEKASPAEATAIPPQTTHTPVTNPPPAAAAAPTPPPATSVTTPAASALEPRRSGVRITADRAAAKGCVYLGDIGAALACDDEDGEASADCAREALEAGGDLIVREGGKAQIFSCRAKP